MEKSAKLMRYFLVQLPSLGLRFLLVSGLLLVGGPMVLLGLVIVGARCRHVATCWNSHYIDSRK